MTENPADEALEALRAHQAATGMQFEDPDAAVTAPPDAPEHWMVTDEEVR